MLFLYMVVWIVDGVNCTMEQAHLHLESVLQAKVDALPLAHSGIFRPIVEVGGIEPEPEVAAAVEVLQRRPAQTAALDRRLFLHPPRAALRGRGEAEPLGGE